MRKFLPLLALLVLAAAPVYSQETAATTTATSSAPTAKVPDDPFMAQYIPRNSRFYIAPIKSEDGEKPIEGFESYLAAAMRKKNVPIIMVTDRSQADFEITGTADKKGAGWAKKVFLGDWRGSASASMQVVNLHTGVVAYADASHRASANKGLRSSAEKLAKYLKKKMEGDEKKMAQRQATK